MLLTHTQITHEPEPIHGFVVLSHLDLTNSHRLARWRVHIHIADSLRGGIPRLTRNVCSKTTEEKKRTHDVDLFSLLWVHSIIQRLFGKCAMCFGFTAGIMAKPSGDEANVRANYITRAV